MHIVELMLLQKKQYYKLGFLSKLKQPDFFLLNHLFKRLFIKALYASINSNLQSFYKISQVLCNFNKIPYSSANLKMKRMNCSLTISTLQQKDTLQLCKLESGKDEMVINYFQQLESISFTKLKRICKLTPFLNSFYSLVNKKSLTQSCSLYRYLSICWQ